MQIQSVTSGAHVTPAGSYLCSDLTRVSNNKEARKTQFVSITPRKSWTHFHFKMDILYDRTCQPAGQQKHKQMKLFWQQEMSQMGSLIRKQTGIPFSWLKQSSGTSSHTPYIMRVTQNRLYFVTLPSKVINNKWNFPQKKINSSKNNGIWLHNAHHISD